MNKDKIYYYTYNPTEIGSIKNFTFREGIKSYIDPGVTIDFYFGADVRNGESATVKVEYGGVANRDVLPEGV